MSRQHRAPAGARWTTLVVSYALAVSACGSTVQVSGSRSLTDGSGLAAPTGGAAGPSDGPSSSSGTISGRPGGGSGLEPAFSGGQPGEATGVTNVPGTTGGRQGARSVPGVTATTIRVGILYSVNGNQAAKTAGVDLDRGNERQDWDAVVAEVNARGGVAGRRLVPVYYVYDAQSTQTFATQEEAECARFTQDTRVFAVLTTGTDTFEECLYRAGVLHATPGSYLGPDREFLRRYPTFFTQRPTQDRMQADLLSALLRQSYFTGWDTLNGAPAGTKAKVGLLEVDLPSITRTVAKVLLPALSRAGHAVDPSDIYRVPNTPSAQEAGPATAAVQNATLHFHQNGITHVIVLDTNGTATLLFAQQSSNQAYYPRLGVTSASGIQQLYDLHALTQKQVQGALGLGWTPALDLPAGQADRYLGSPAKVCLDVIKRRTGQTFSSTTAAGVALISCDAGFTFAAALNGVGRELTLNSAVRAYESVGRGIVSALVGRLFFSPTHHDGLEVAYDMAWDAGCSCTRYRDSGHRMP
jgi:hypothetical protein